MNRDSLEDRRVWLVGGAVLALLLVAASWFLVISPKRGEASDTRAEARDNDLANSRLTARHGALVRQQANIAGLRANLAAALDALPPTSALPEFTQQATQAAAVTGVTLNTIAVGALTPVTPTGTAGQAPAPAAPSATPAPSTSAAAGTASTAATQYQISITLTTSGPNRNQLDFVKAIQNAPRQALVTSTSFAGTGTKVSLTSQLTIFTAPMSNQQVAQLRRLLVSG